MGVECTSCGHVIPAGQFRCGKCGALAPPESMEDFGGLTEVAFDQAVPSAPLDALVAPVQPLLAAAVEVSAGAQLEAQTLPLERVRDEDSRQPEYEPAPVKEALVPKGTFASEAPQPSPAPVERPEASQEPRPIAPAREPPESGPVRSAAQSSSQRLREAHVAQRPPFLASESLREDQVPLEPGKETFAPTLQVAGLLGLAANLLVAFDSLAGWLCAAVCAGLVLLGRLPLSYTRRAGAVTALAGAALLSAVLGRLSLGASRDELVLVAACCLLPGALLFRSWYRSARLARSLVSVALVLGCAWPVLTINRGLLTLGFTWQSWIPALAWYLFCILCLLSLLAFMGDETTGGCHAWALGTSLWFGLFACLRWALERETFSAEARDSAAALGLSEAALSAPLAVALAQLFARAYVARSRPLRRAS